MKQKLGLVCALIHTPRCCSSTSDQRRRSRFSPRFLANPLSTAAGEGDDLRFHGLSRRGRTLQPRGVDAPRPAVGVRTPAELKKLMRGAILELRCDEPRQAVAVLKRELVGASVGLFGDRCMCEPRTRSNHGRGEGGIGPSRLGVVDIRLIEPSLEDVSFRC